MTQQKWYFVLNVVLLFLAVFLLIRRIYNYVTTGEIDYFRISINALFVGYLVFRMVQNKQNS